jgi:RNase H-fold protein (predicted Holliday junction resolvase)
MIQIPWHNVETAIKRLKTAFPQIPIVPVDEHFSLQAGKRGHVRMGMKKKDRRKRLVDECSGIMLQVYGKPPSDGL